MASYGYKPYTTGAPTYARPGQGYAPGGVNYISSPAPRPVPRYTPPRAGYAPGGVLYKPLDALKKAIPATPANLGDPDAWYTNYVANHPAGAGNDDGLGTVTMDQPAGAGGQAPGAPPAGESADPYPNDPVYQQIVGIANQEVADAEASATAARKQLAIQLGDPGIATSLGLGALTASAAAANPFSTLKNLLRSHNTNRSAIDSSLNRANLFSSSTRNRQQQLEGSGYLSGVAGANANAQGVLSQILGALLGAKRGAAARKAEAAANAYGRREQGTSGADEAAPPAGGTGPDGEWTQADAFAALLANAYKRADNPLIPGGV